MTTNKLPKKQDKKLQISEHPLAKLAGKFEGEFWENPLLEIQNLREIEKLEINKTLDNRYSSPKSFVKVLDPRLL